jgi:hypothetical protein
MLFGEGIVTVANCVIEFIGGIKIGQVATLDALFI